MKFIFYFFCLSVTAGSSAQILDSIIRKFEPGCRIEDAIINLKDSSFIYQTTGYYTKNYWQVINGQTSLVLQTGKSTFLNTGSELILFDTSHGEVKINKLEVSNDTVILGKRIFINNVSSIINCHYYSIMYKKGQTFIIFNGEIVRVIDAIIPNDQVYFDKVNDLTYLTDNELYWDLHLSDGTEIALPTLIKSIKLLNSSDILYDSAGYTGVLRLDRHSRTTSNLVTNINVVHYSMQSSALLYSKDTKYYLLDKQVIRVLPTGVSSLFMLASRRYLPSRVDGKGLVHCYKIKPNRPLHFVADIIVNHPLSSLELVKRDLNISTLDGIIYKFRRRKVLDSIDLAANIYGICQYIDNNLIYYGNFSGILNYNLKGISATPCPFCDEFRNCFIGKNNSFISQSYGTKRILVGRRYTDEKNVNYLQLFAYNANYSGKIFFTNKSRDTFYGTRDNISLDVLTIDLSAGVVKGFELVDSIKMSLLKILPTSQSTAFILTSEKRTLYFDGATFRETQFLPFDLMKTFTLMRESEQFILAVGSAGKIMLYNSIGEFVDSIPGLIDYTPVDVELDSRVLWVGFSNKPTELDGRPLNYSNIVSRDVILVNNVVRIGNKLVFINNLRNSFEWNL